MPRELNPELFKSLQKELEQANAQKEAQIAPVSPVSQRTQNTSSYADQNPFEPDFEVLEKDWMAVIEQIRKLTKGQKDHQVGMQKLESQVSEAIGSIKVRVERIGAGAQRVDEKAEMKFSEVNQKLASLSGKVTERKVSDQKIEELLGRHNQTVQNFEVRLQQMAKLISEQEMQLVSYRSALAEAKREIERLRR